MTKNKRLISTRGNRIDVDPDAVSAWKVKRQHGDMQRIVKALGVCHSVVMNAFAGRAQQPVIDAINAFFKINP